MTGGGNNDSEFTLEFEIVNQSSQNGKVYFPYVDGKELKYKLELTWDEAFNKVEAVIRKKHGLEYNYSGFELKKNGYVEIENTMYAICKSKNYFLSYLN